MNERTHFIKIYLSHFILERVDVGCVWEVSRKRGRTAIWPKFFFDHSGTSISSWLGCSTVGHWGPKALYLPLALMLASCPQLTPTGTDSDRLCAWLYLYLTPTCFRCSSTYLHRCISWLTARSRVNMLLYGSYSSHNSYYKYIFKAHKRQKAEESQQVSIANTFKLNSPDKCLHVHVNRSDLLKW